LKGGVSREGASANRKKTKKNPKVGGPHIKGETVPGDPAFRTKVNKNPLGKKEPGKRKRAPTGLGGWGTKKFRWPMKG